MKEKPQEEVKAREPDVDDSIAMVRRGDTGPGAVIARVKPQDVAAARADGWVEKD